MSLLVGKSVLITGGASSIGLATADLAAREGARVAISDQDASGGQTAAERIVAFGGDAMFVQMDVADRAQVEAGIEACVQRFGRLDGAFNNAGISTNPRSGTPQKAADISKDAWQRVVAFNLSGVWRCMCSKIHQILGV